MNTDGTLKAYVGLMLIYKKTETGRDLSVYGASWPQALNPHWHAWHAWRLSLMPLQLVCTAFLLHLIGRLYDHM